MSVYLYRWSPAARRSNHICFQVTFTGSFTADWESFLFFQVPSLSQVFPIAGNFLGFVSVPQISNGLPNIINVLSHDRAQHGHQCAIPGPGRRLKYIGFHSCSERGPMRACKNRSTDGLSHSQLPKNLLNLLYRFPAVMCPERFPLLGQASCGLEQSNL